MRLALFLIGSLALAQSWQLQESGSTASLRGISAVNGKVAWASGAKGTVLRTTDGGATWSTISPSGAADADFRDIEAIDERTAYAMSAGEGRASRIYKTADAGVTWTMQRANQDPDGFWDSFGMWDATHGILMGDPVNGRFTILSTRDGLTWNAMEGPKTEKGEAAFAASGTALITRGTREAWFASSIGRIFHTDDAGKTWTIARATVMPYGIAFAGKTGAAVGGDYQKPSATQGNFAITEDGSKWTVPQSAPRGYRSAVAYVADRKVWITVGTSGSDASSDLRTWRGFDDGAFNALSVGTDGSVWAVGPEGRIAKLLF